MEEVTCHLLPFEVACGAHNMAADEVLLNLARPGVAALRFYGWSEPTISLGYFQPCSVRETREEWKRLLFVRRPTGGGMLVHHHELTYALAVYLQDKPSTWLERMHGAIARALAGLAVGVGQVKQAKPTADEPLCFHQLTPGDIVCGGAKVGGSAQRKRGNTLLQHGAVLLAQSEHAPSLPGISEKGGVRMQQKELAQAIGQEFEAETHWTLHRVDWSGMQREAIGRLEADRYRTRVWNERR